MAYKHGPYATRDIAGAKNTELAQAAFVVFGTAPVHTVEGGAANVSVPVLVNDYAEAAAEFGYSDDWASFSLCEVMFHVLKEKGVGPLVLINTFNPATHKESTGGTASLTPQNGRLVIADAALIELDSVVIKTTAETPVTKVKGTDYAISYNSNTQTITAVELTAGALGSAALTVTWEIAKPSAVSNADFIGSDDGNGLRTGVFAIRNVWQLTGMIPSYMAAPGWSCIPAIHEAMHEVSQGINGHWDTFMFTDIPIVDSNSTPITLSTAYTWKMTNGYNKTNEKPSFPMIEGKDGKKYHLSTLRIANFLQLLITNDGVPYYSDSNTEIPIAQNLWLGASAGGRVYDDKMINEKLCENGIAGACWVGYWATWGAHAGDYDQTSKNKVNVADTNILMLMYCTNDFQARHFADTDKPKSPNDIRAMAQDEQTIMDRRVSAGQLTYGNVQIRADAIARSDMYNGDYMFTIEVSTTPLMKSITADVVWTDEGYAAYYAGINEAEGGE